jgi:hypothetical protein
MQRIDRCRDLQKVEWRGWLLGDDDDDDDARRRLLEENKPHCLPYPR